MRLNANGLAIRANTLYRKNNRERAKSSERLASGFRINRAADDAAGLAISQRMEAQSRGLEQNARNIQDGISLLDTADSAIGSMQENAQRMRELTIQAGNDTLVEEDRNAIRNEMKELESHMGRVAKETEFNNMPLIDGTFSKKTEDASNGLETGPRVPDDGTPVSQELELNDFDVEFRFQDISDAEMNKLQIELWHDGKRLGKSVLEDNPLQWEESAGGTELDIGSDIIPTEDGGFIAVGTTSSKDNDVDGSDAEDSIFAVKFSGDTNGSPEERIEWAQTFDSSEIGLKSEGVSISNLPDEDGYLISGAASSDKGDSDIILMKIDKDGDVKFKNTYGGQNDYGKSIHNIEDGGKILAGNVDGRHGKKDILLLKMDSEGIFKWEKQIENFENDDFVYDVKSIDNGYLVAGRSENDAVIHKVDNDGNLIETNNNSDELHPGRIKEVQQLDNGDIVTVGYNGDDIEVRKLNSDLELEGDQTISNGSLDSFIDGLGVEIVNNNDTEEIVITGSSEPGDGSKEVSAVKLDTDLNIQWKSYNKDAGSHGNKGDQIYANTDGGYLVTAGEINNKLVQFDQHGIYQGEIDLSEYSNEEYADYDINQIVSGADNYYAVLENNDNDSLQLAEISYVNGDFNEDNISITNIGDAINDHDDFDLDSLAFETMHLLNQGEGGLVIQTAKGDDTALHRVNRVNSNLDSVDSFKAADEFETINNITLNNDGNLAVVGKTQRGNITVEFKDVDSDAEIYDNLEINFESADSEGVSFNHNDENLTISLDKNQEYDIDDINQLISDNARHEDVVTYYDAEDLKGFLEGINDYFNEPGFDDPSKEYLNFEIDGDGSLNTFDLDGETLTLNSEDGATAKAELEINGTTLTVTGNTAFNENDEITISDDSGINETISFNTNDDQWSINPDDKDDVFSQAEEIESIINDHLDGHEVTDRDENVLTITESEGEATGTDIEISTDDNPYLEFVKEENSVEEQLGEYNFTVNTNFEDGDTLTIGDQEFAFSDDENDDIKVEEEITPTLENLKEELVSLDRWGEITVDNDNKITFKEVEGQATGKAPNLELVNNNGDSNISDLNTDNESITEVQGEYTLTVGNKEVFENKEIEFNSIPGLEPGDEEAEIVKNNKLTFDLAEDIDLEKFEISSDVTFETSAEKWAKGSELTIKEDNNYSDSDFYLNSLENLWLAEFDNSGEKVKVSEETYGGSNNDIGLAIKEIDGGGYIITGKTSSDDGQLEDIDGIDNDALKTWITILDEDLNIEDQAVETDEELAELTEIRQQGDDYLLFGKLEDNTPVVYTLSENGEDWTASAGEIIEGLNIDSDISIAETDDGYLITGNDSNNDVFKIFSNGDINDFNNLSTKNSEASAITALDDGSVVLASNKEVLTGDGESIESGDVRKLDSNGELVWEAKLDDIDEQIDEVKVEDIQVTDNGDFILTGMRDEEMVVYELDEAGNTNWSRTYEGLSSLSIDQADDGNYVITGHRDMVNTEEIYLESEKSDDDIIADMTVLKVDANNSGEIIWRKDYGADNEVAGNSFPTEDGGMITIGTITSYTNHKSDTDGDYTADKDAVIMKTDEAGNWEWDVTLGDDNLDKEGIHIEESYDSDGEFDGYIMTGLKETDDGDKDIWVSKLGKIEDPEDGESEFEITWEETFGGEGDETVGNITTTDDGGYILTGSIEKDGNSDLWVKKLSNDGNVKWDRQYGGSGNDFGNHIEQTEDGGYIITGSSSSADLGSNELQGDEDLLIVRLDNDGEVQWSDLLGGSGSDQGLSVREFDDRRYIVTGSSSSNDGDVESRIDNDDLNDQSMWTLEYSRAFSEETLYPDEEAEKTAPIGTGMVYLDIEQAYVQFDWEENEVVEMSAVAEQRTDAKFGVQNGPNSSNKVLTRIDNLRLEELGFEEGWLDGDFSDPGYVAKTLETIDGAIDKLSSARSEIGAFTNRLEHSLNNTENYRENLETARSRIKDVNMAKEVMEQARHEIVHQASIAMMAQANQAPQTILQLIN